jgi:squalene-associated FAD-dependent desaturase
MRLGYLTLGERWSIARALMRLARTQVPSGRDETIGQWLVRHGQSEQAIERFWSVVLVSALGETVQRASLAASQKVFCDGFLASRTAYEMETATVPLGEIWRRVGEWLSERGAVLHLGAGVRQIVGDGCRATGLVLRNGTRLGFDFAISAVPWRQVARLLDPQLLAAMPMLRTVDQIEPAPITAVHLWFDRAITPLPHAALIGRLSHWVFADREASFQLTDGGGASCQLADTHHYAVVISASRGLRGRERSDILANVRCDLEAVFPAAREAELRSFRILTQPAAVFSVLPGLDRLRPPQRTPVPNLFLAGDWTATGWPATMEGAVRSGNRAAEALLASTPSLQGEKMLEWDSGQ